MNAPATTLAQRIGEQLAREPAENGLPRWARELAARDRARFLDHGLPHRRLEAWKYTPLDARPAPGEAQSPVDGFDAGEGVLVRLVNGAPQELPAGLPEGVRLRTIADELAEAPEDLRAALESIDTESPADVMTALNNADLGGGLVLRVARDVDAGQLVLCWRDTAQAPALANARVLVWLEEGARLDLVEDFAPGRALNVVQQFHLAPGSRLRHARLQAGLDASWLVTRTEVSQAGHSVFEQASLDIGDGLARHDLGVRLAGSGAACTALGAYLPGGEAHVDHHLDVRHEATDCHSTQTFRGVLQDRGRAVFNGRVHVLPGADGSEAHQSNKNLLLSHDAEVDTKPELVIEADEVVASHGATVGALDDKAVFYLRSRGIGEPEARRMLTGAFCREVIEAIGIDAARDAFLARLESHLEVRP